MNRRFSRMVIVGFAIGLVSVAEAAYAYRLVTIADGADESATADTIVRECHFVDNTAYIRSLEACWTPRRLDRRHWLQIA